MSSSILMIIADSEVRSQLSLLLREVGLNPEACTAPEQALELLQDRTYGGVILERELAGLDGLELLRRVRAIVTEIPVLLVCDETPSGSTMVPYRLGASAILTKPLASRSVLRRLREIWGREGQGETAETPRGGSLAPFAAFRKQRATQAPFAPKSKLESPVEPLTRRTSSTPSPVPSRPLVAPARTTEVPPVAEYQPRYLLGRSAATRQLLDHLWKHRNFSRVLVVAGETGCEFELVARELWRAGGQTKGFLQVLESAEINEEAIHNLDTMALLREGERPMVFVPDIHHLSESARGVLCDFMQHMAASERPRLRLVLGVALDKAEEAEHSESSLEALLLACEARLDITPLRERAEEIPLLARHLLEQIIMIHPFLKVREIEASAMGYLQGRLWKQNFEQLATVLRVAAAGSPQRVITTSQLEALLESDLTSFHLLESSADSILLEA